MSRVRALAREKALAGRCMLRSEVYAYVLKCLNFCNLKTKTFQITCKLGTVAIFPTCVTCLLNADFVKAYLKSRAVWFYF